MGAVAYRGSLWSNSNSRYHMPFIDTAQHRLRIQHPKRGRVIPDHTPRCRGRGVNVRALCGGRHGISEWDISTPFASLRTLRRFE